jgi:hypothetical protein
VKVRATFLCLCLLAAALGARAQSSSKIVSFDQLCGELSFVTPVSGGGMDSVQLKNVKLELYSWEEGIACCRNSHPFFRAVTDNEGTFEFKDVDPGRYWLVVHYQKKLFRLAVAIDPDEPGSAACGYRLFEIDAKGRITTGLRSEM